MARGRPRKYVPPEEPKRRIVAEAGEEKPKSKPYRPIEEKPREKRVEIPMVLIDSLKQGERFELAGEIYRFESSVQRPDGIHQFGARKMVSVDGRGMVPAGEATILQSGTSVYLVK